MSEYSLYKSILSSIATAIILLDKTFQVIYTNPAAGELLETGNKRLIQNLINKWLVSNIIKSEQLTACIATGSHYTQREALLLSSTGNSIRADYSVIPLLLDDKTYLLLEMQPKNRLLGIERKEELRIQHANAHELVRGMAHEIKNPLGGIRGAAQLLERELPEQALHDYTRIIIQEADRLHNLVDRMLGANQRLQLEKLNIHALLERICDLVSVETKNTVKIIRDYDPSIPELYADNEQLIQAILNIVKNAIQVLEDAKVEKPEIRLTTRTHRQLTLNSTPHRLVCAIAICDNGPGISEQLISRIFYPMISGRAQGTGLGLSIAQSIISQHQGMIECMSKPGTTCFQIFIPMELNDETSS